MKIKSERINRTLRVALAALLVCSMLSVQACDKILDAADRIIAIAKVGREALPVLKDEGLIDDAEQRDITDSLDAISQPMEEFISKARSFKDDSSAARDELAGTFAGVEAALNRFDANVVLHLKNPKAQNRGRLWLAGMRASARVIRSYLPERGR
jgi:hypothetical protein